MTNQSYGLFQKPEPIKIDLDAMLQRAREQIETERLEAVRRYMMARYMNSTRWQG